MAKFSTVAAIHGNGSVFAVNASGVSRLLKVGDSLEKGETVRTVGDVRVELMMEDGRSLAVAPQQSVRLDDNVVESDQRPTAQDSALSTTATADTIIQSLNRGGDLNQELAATAAGVAAGTAEDSGHSFVQLLRITEGVNPLSYNYSFAAPTVTPDLQLVSTGATTTLTLSADANVAEGSAGITYHGTLGLPAISDMTITLSNGAVMVIAAGATSGSVLVPVHPNDVYTTPETLVATVGTVQGGGFTTVTVNDSNVVTLVHDVIDTTQLSLTATPSITEAGTSISYTVTLVHPAQAGAPVTVQLSNGETLTIAGGASSATVVHAVLPNEDVYIDPGTVSATITGASGGNFENLTINPAPAVTNVTDTINTTQLSLSGSTVLEGAGANYTFTAALSNPSQGDTTVVTNQGTITIHDGQSSGTLVLASGNSEDPYIGGVKVGYSQRSHNAKPIEIVVKLPRSAEWLGERILSTPLPAGGTRRQGANVELGDVVTVKREPASYTLFRRDGRFAEMVQAEVAGRFEAPIYGMLAVEGEIAKLDWGKAGPPTILYHGQPADESKSALLWDGEWEVTYVTFRDMGAAFGVALLGIYLLVVAQFGSYRLPLVILTPVPLTLIGIVLGPLDVRRALHGHIDDRVHRTRRHHRAQLDPAGRLRPAPPCRGRRAARCAARGGRHPLQADLPDRGCGHDRRRLHPHRPDLSGAGDFDGVWARILDGAHRAGDPGDLCLAA